MRKIICLFLLLISSAGYCGGTIGGSGGLASWNLIVIEEPDLGLQKLEIAPADFRRARIRLCAGENASVKVEGELVLLKETQGGITDLHESLQILPKVL